MTWETLKEMLAMPVCILLFCSGDFHIVARDIFELKSDPSFLSRRTMHTTSSNQTTCMSWDLWVWEASRLMLQRRDRTAQLMEGALGDDCSFRWPHRRIVGFNGFVHWPDHTIVYRCIFFFTRNCQHTRWIYEKVSILFLSTTFDSVAHAISSRLHDCI